MHSINQRIRELRKALRLNQETFGAILGISKSGVCDIEAGRRRVTEAHILLLISQDRHPISEQWLRTGNGSMFRRPAKSLISLGDETDALFRALAEAYLELDFQDRQVLMKFLHHIDDKIKQSGSGEPPPPPRTPAP